MRLKLVILKLLQKRQANRVPHQKISRHRAKKKKYRIKAQTRQQYKARISKTVH